MRIRIEPHTLERAKERGASETEILDTLENGLNILARGHRKGKAKVFDFKQERLGTYYEQKRVEVIYIEESDVVITVTVYVFYGERKD